MKKTAMLIIMDGFGCDSSVEIEGAALGCFSSQKMRDELAEARINAIAAAPTPNLDRLFRNYPHTFLGASGSSVGLPDGQMGNSEVGHMNIGAGRIIYQDLTRITRSVEDESFFENPALKSAMTGCATNHSALHIMGLLSDGGVHSHINHLLAILDMAKREQVENVFIHCFLDGRDVPPRCAQNYINILENHLSSLGIGKIAGIAGRYYAMDRDKRWDRIQKAYDALTSGEGFQAVSASEALKNAYERNENDEFVQPTVIIDSSKQAAGTVKDGDSVIMFNFRPDRAREITRCLCDKNFKYFNRKVFPKLSSYICMTEYDASMPFAKLAFPPESYKNTLGEYLSSLGKKQLRLAETEKYAHVTFFFNGGREKPYLGEDRILVPSPNVATYDLQPEMSAEEVCENAVSALESGKYDLIVMNFANPDMVGHTGIFEATVAAVAKIDECIGRISAAAEKSDCTVFITSDHGNADTMKSSDGKVVTAHSVNPVPALLLTSDKTLSLRSGGKLADIAPTLLSIMNLPKPKEMTGISLIEKK